MCLEKFSVIIKRKAFQNSVWYKSNAGEKIIPVFSRQTERERERVKNMPKTLHQKPPLTLFTTVLWFTVKNSGVSPKSF